MHVTAQDETELNTEEKYHKSFFSENKEDCSLSVIDEAEDYANIYSLPLYEKRESFVFDCETDDSEQESKAFEELFTEEVSAAEANWFIAAQPQQLLAVFPSVEIITSEQDDILCSESADSTFTLCIKQSPSRRLQRKIKLTSIISIIEIYRVLNQNDGNAMKLNSPMQQLVFKARLHHTPDMFSPALQQLMLVASKLSGCPIPKNTATPLYSMNIYEYYAKMHRQECYAKLNELTNHIYMDPSSENFVFSIWLPMFSWGSIVLFNKITGNITLVPVIEPTLRGIVLALSVIVKDACPTNSSDFISTSKETEKVYQSFLHKEVKDADKWINSAKALKLCHSWKLKYSQHVLYSLQLPRTQFLLKLQLGFDFSDSSVCFYPQVRVYDNVSSQNSILKQQYGFFSINDRRKNEKTSKWFLSSHMHKGMYSVKDMHTKFLQGLWIVKNLYLTQQKYETVASSFDYNVKTCESLSNNETYKMKKADTVCSKSEISAVTFLVAKAESPPTENNQFEYLNKVELFWAYKKKKMILSLSELQGLQQKDLENLIGDKGFRTLNHTKHHLQQAFDDEFIDYQSKVSQKVLNDIEYAPERASNSSTYATRVNANKKRFDQLHNHVSCLPYNELMRFCMLQYVKKKVEIKKQIPRLRSKFACNVVNCKSEDAESLKSSNESLDLVPADHENNISNHELEDDRHSITKSEEGGFSCSEKSRTSTEETASLFFSQGSHNCLASELDEEIFETKIFNSKGTVSSDALSDSSSVTVSLDSNESMDLNNSINMHENFEPLFTYNNQSFDSSSSNSTSFEDKINFHENMRDQVHTQAIASVAQSKCNQEFLEIGVRKLCTQKYALEISNNFIEPRVHSRHDAINITYQDKAFDAPIVELHVSIIQRCNIKTTKSLIQSMLKNVMNQNQSQESSDTTLFSDSLEHVNQQNKISSTLLRPEGKLGIAQNIETDSQKERRLTNIVTDENLDGVCSSTSKRLDETIVERSIKQRQSIQTICSKEDNYENIQLLNSLEFTQNNSIPLATLPNQVDFNNEVNSNNKAENKRAAEVLKFAENFANKRQHVNVLNQEQEETINVSESPYQLTKRLKQVPKKSKNNTDSNIIMASKCIPLQNYADETPLKKKRSLRQSHQSAKLSSPSLQTSSMTLDELIHELALDQRKRKIKSLQLNETSKNSKEKNLENVLYKKSPGTMINNILFSDSDTKKLNRKFTETAETKESLKKSDKATKNVVVSEPTQAIVTSSKEAVLKESKPCQLKSYSVEVNDFNLVKGGKKNEICKNTVFESSENRLLKNISNSFDAVNKNTELQNLNFQTAKVEMSPNNCKTVPHRNERPLLSTNKKEALEKKKCASFSPVNTRDGNTKSNKTKQNLSEKESWSVIQHLEQSNFDNENTHLKTFLRTESLDISKKSQNSVTLPETTRVGDEDNAFSFDEKNLQLIFSQKHLEKQRNSIEKPSDERYGGVKQTLQVTKKVRDSQQTTSIINNQELNSVKENFFVIKKEEENLRTAPKNVKHNNQSLNITVEKYVTSEDHQKNQEYKLNSKKLAFSNNFIETAKSFELEDLNSIDQEESGNKALKPHFPHEKMSCDTTEEQSLQQQIKNPCNSLKNPVAQNFDLSRHSSAQLPLKEINRDCEARKNTLLEKESFLDKTQNTYSRSITASEFSSSEKAEEPTQLLLVVKKNSSVSINEDKASFEFRRQDKFESVKQIETNEKSPTKETQTSQQSTNVALTDKVTFNENDSILEIKKQDGLQSSERIKTNETLPTVNTQTTPQESTAVTKTDKVTFKKNEITFKLKKQDGLQSSERIETNETLPTVNTQTTPQESTAITKTDKVTFKEDEITFELKKQNNLQSVEQIETNEKLLTEKTQTTSQQSTIVAQTDKVNSNENKAIYDIIKDNDFILVKQINTDKKLPTQKTKATSQKLSSVGNTHKVNLNDNETSFKLKKQDDLQLVKQIETVKKLPTERAQATTRKSSNIAKSDKLTLNEKQAFCENQSFDQAKLTEGRNNENMESVSKEKKLKASLSYNKEKNKSFVEKEKCFQGLIQCFGTSEIVSKKDCDEHSNSNTVYSTTSITSKNIEVQTHVEFLKDVCHYSFEENEQKNSKILNEQETDTKLNKHLNFIVQAAALKKNDVGVAVGINASGCAAPKLDQDEASVSNQNKRCFEKQIRKGYSQNIAKSKISENLDTKTLANIPTLLHKESSKYVDGSITRTRTSEASSLVAKIQKAPAENEHQALLSNKKTKKLTKNDANQFVSQKFLGQFIVAKNKVNDQKLQEMFAKKSTPITEQKDTLMFDKVEPAISNITGSKNVVNQISSMFETNKLTDAPLSVQKIKNRTKNLETFVERNTISAFDDGSIGLTETNSEAEHERTEFSKPSFSSNKTFKFSEKVSNRFDKDIAIEEKLLKNKTTTQNKQFSLLNLEKSEFASEFNQHLNKTYEPQKKFTKQLNLNGLCYNVESANQEKDLFHQVSHTVTRDSFEKVLTCNADKTLTSTTPLEINSEKNMTKDEAAENMVLSQDKLVFFNEKNNQQIAPQSLKQADLAQTLATTNLKDANKETLAKTIEAKHVKGVSTNQTAGTTLQISLLHSDPTINLKHKNTEMTIKTDKLISNLEIKNLKSDKALFAESNESSLADEIVLNTFSSNKHLSLDNGSKTYQTYKDPSFLSSAANNNSPKVNQFIKEFMVFPREDLQILPVLKQQTKVGVNSIKSNSEKHNILLKTSTADLKTLKLEFQEASQTHSPEITKSSIITPTNADRNFSLKVPLFDNFDGKYQTSKSRLRSRSAVPETYLCTQSQVEPIYSVVKKPNEAETNLFDKFSLKKVSSQTFSTYSSAATHTMDQNPETYVPHNVNVSSTLQHPFSRFSNESICSENNLQPILTKNYQTQWNSLDTRKLKANSSVVYETIGAAQAAVTISPVASVPYYNSTLSPPTTCILIPSLKPAVQLQQLCSNDALVNKDQNFAVLNQNNAKLKKTQSLSQTVSESDICRKHSEMKLKKKNCTCCS